MRMRASLRDSSEDALNREVASWGKFLALTDLLEYSLSDVAEWLPKCVNFMLSVHQKANDFEGRRKFSSFTRSEMMSLIKALFQESPRRQLVLSTIAEMRT